MRILTGILFTVLGANAWAQPITPGKNEDDILFAPVSELNQSPLTPKLGNAEVADPAEWPASFFSKSTGFRCTSTLVGPQVLLTAAHCVGNGKKASFKLNDEEHSGPCNHHPEYPADASADYALCELSKVVTGVPYESINRDANLVRKGNRLRLSGYGCITLAGTGSVDGKYRIGEAPVTALPGEIAGEPNTIITVSYSEEDALLCKGDSGGAAFVESAISAARTIVAVNSRVWAEKRRSYLSSVTSPRSREWFFAWINGKQTRRICGLDPEPEGCR